MKSSRTLPGVASMLLSLTAASTALADVQLSKIFSDHMIVQQNQPIRVWGQAAPGEEVSITFSDQNGTGKAGADGKWRIDLPALKADGKVHTMTVKGANTITLNYGKSVLVWNDKVKAPTHVRFGYESNPAGINLYNREGFPASPFTTD
jgi:hypothetical protein